jgi:hypothetical protein
MENFKSSHRGKKINITQILNNTICNITYHWVADYSNGKKLVINHIEYNYAQIISQKIPAGGRTV